MTELLPSMAYPFLACLILTGIHVYLGIHVIERQVIFVDLALATIAALGAVWGALLGWDIHEDVWVIKGFSLAFTFIGAAIFSLTRMRHERVPQEAIIGITYAVALASIILGSSKLAHGAEEVRDLQAGSILWISGETIVFTALLYAAIGAFHWTFRRHFFAISRDPARAEAEGLNVRLWDFLFYVSFGFVVTSSVSIAGVLLVFSYLVIPSVVAVLFVDGIRRRLALGWAVGTLVSVVGLTFSYYQDLPSGPVIVVGFGLFLALAGTAHYLVHAPSRARAGVQVATGAAGVALFTLASLLLRRSEDLDLAHLLESGVKGEQVSVLAEVAERPELWPQVAPLAAELLANADVVVRLRVLDLVAANGALELLPAVHPLLTDPDDVIRERALKCVHDLGSDASIEPLLAAAAVEEDDYIKVDMAEAVVELGERRGIDLLIDVMEHGDAQQARKDAYEHLSAHLDSPPPFHPEPGFAGHAAEVAAIREWWNANRTQPLRGTRR